MDGIMSLLQDFDIANLLPEPDVFLNDLEGKVRLVLLAAPLVLLILGLLYYFAPPKRGRAWGFRTNCALASEGAWRFTQKVAGICYAAVGGALSVLMLIISFFFQGEHALAMVNTAIICIILELIVILAARLFIRALVSRAYDETGRRRK